MLKNGINRKKAQLLEEKYATDEMFTDCFTVELEYRATSNRLYIFADSDSGMTFEKCQKLSRFIEHHVDTNGWLGEKYVLEVSSPGISRPFKFPRQYPKNIGRKLEVTYPDKTKTEGTLTACDDTKIVLTSEVVEKEGKKKVKKEVITEIPYTNIHKAIVKLAF